VTPGRSFYMGSSYHIYNRGNHRETVFHDRDDRRFFLSKLDTLCERDRVTIIAYCLMDNHFHLLLRQDGGWPLSKTMRSLMTSLAKRYNKKYGAAGHLFQGSYKVGYIRGPAHLLERSRYVHRNPEKIADIRDYRWSSYRQYLGGGVGVADAQPVLGLFESKRSYAMYVETDPILEIGKRDGKFYVVGVEELAPSLAGVHGS
jgi:putative transposase